MSDDGPFVKSLVSGFSHMLAVEIEAAGVVNGPIKDGVCEGLVWMAPA